MDFRHASFLIREALGKADRDLNFELGLEKDVREKIFKILDNRLQIEFKNELW